MKRSLPRLGRKIYRQEPISAFIFTMAIADVLLGSFNERWTVFSLGIFLTMVSVAIRWLIMHKNRRRVKASVRRYLTPSRRASVTPMPYLKRKRDYR